ncbi:hypothetical protein OPQ81_000128 [Rhizoctonia solani]|nr:hypothetical protein OPQ81_000128 [Rhizoctonia solani]
MSLLLCLVCTCGHLGSAKLVTNCALEAQGPNCQKYVSGARVGCEAFGGNFVTDQITSCSKYIISRAENATTTSNSPTPTPGSDTGTGSSVRTLTIVIGTVGLVFVGFLLYFAWQCIACIRGPRSGKPVFGYVGV